jgi:replicative DNA helicase
VGDLGGLVPRHDLGAEAAVLSACLLDTAARDVALSELEPEHFYSEPNRHIFDAVRALALAGEAVDIVQVASWLRARELIARCGGPKYLADIVDKTPAPGNVSAHAATVRKLARLRDVQQLGHKIASEGYGDVGDPDEWIDTCESRMHALAHNSRRDNALMPCRQVLVQTFEQISAAAERGGSITGIPTGYADLDKKIAGLHRGDLMIVAARPGVGKSTKARCVAVNVARDEAAGGAVAIFSLEMPKEQIGAALICAEGDVDLARLRQGQLTEDDWKRLANAGTELSVLPIWIDDTPGVTLLYVRAQCRRLKAQLERDGIPFGAIIVDYLQLMRGSGRTSSREQEISEISRGLKELAKELSVPVIALSQLNRAVETRSSRDKDNGKRPQLSDLRESGSIEQDADVVIFVYRHEMYEPDNVEVRGLAEFIVAKQRNGPTGTVRVRFVKHCTKFVDLQPGEFEETEEEWG